MTVAQEVDYRLPRNLYPEHYDIELRPDFYPPLTTSQFFFDGWVTLHLRCDVATDLIHIHFRSMTINGASLVVTSSENPSIDVLGTSVDSVREFYIIQVDRPFKVGEQITVSMNFTGPIKNDYMGLYYSQYNESGQVK